VTTDLKALASCVRAFQCFAYDDGAYCRLDQGHQGNHNDDGYVWSPSAREQALAALLDAIESHSNREATIAPLAKLEGRG